MGDPARSPEDERTRLPRISSRDIPGGMKGRKSVVFQSGNSMAVRLLGDCRLPKGTRVRQYRDGRRIIVEPISEWPQEFIDVLGTVDEEIPRPTEERVQRDPFE